MFNTIDYILWAVIAVFDSWLFAVIISKKLYRRFPALTLYAVYKLTIRHGLLYALLAIGGYDQYFWPYWASYGTVIVIYFFVVRELFLFDSRLLVIGMGLVGGIALILANLMPGREPHFMPIIRSAEMGLWVCVVGLFIWSLLDRPQFQLMMERYMAGALCLYAVCQLLKSIAVSLIGYKATVGMRTGSAVAYIACVTIWIYTLKQPLDEWFTEAMKDVDFIKALGIEAK